MEEDEPCADFLEDMRVATFLGLPVDARFGLPLRKFFAIDARNAVSESGKALTEHWSLI